MKLNSNIIKIVFLVLTLKIILLSVGFVAFSYLPFSTANYNSNFHYPTDENKNILPLKTWDGQHYLYLAEFGYKKNQESNRFFPLYPFAITILSKVGIPHLLGSFILSTVFSAAACCLLFLICKKIFNKSSIAFDSVFYFLAFPTAFFLSLPYSEALFLFLTLLFFFFLEKKKLFYACLVSTLIPLTRPNGILILVPFFVYLLTVSKNNVSFSFPTFNKPIKVGFSPLYFLLFGPFIGVLLYFLCMKFFLGDPFLGISGLNSVSSWNIGNIVDPFSLLKNLFTTKLDVHSFQNSFIDRTFFGLFIIFLPFIYKKLPKHYFVFALSVALIPFFGSFTSYTRYVLVAFPIFLTLAAYLNNEKLSFLRYAIFLLFFSFQIIFFVMHILNYWVA